MIARTILNAFSAGLGMATNGNGLRLSNPELAKILGLGGQQTLAGVNIDHESVMALPAVMRGVSIVASQVGAVDYSVVRVDEGFKEDDPTHISWPVIADEPHNEFTQDTFRETMTAYAMLWGNGVAHINRPSTWPISGEIELTPLLPDRTQPVRITEKDVERFDFDVNVTGMLFYKTIIDGEEFSFPASDCIHIRGLGPNVFWGWDVVEILRQTFGGARASREFGERFFGQGAAPAGFVEAPAGLSDEAQKRFNTSVKRAVGGLGKSHRLVLLEEGAKFNPWVIDPEKAQFLEGKEFDIRELAMAIGIKPHKLIDTANSSYNSLGESNKEHKDDDLLPWLRRWRMQYRKKLLTREQRVNREYDVRFDDRFLEYTPYSEKAKGTVDLFNNGIIDKEEARTECGLNPSKRPNGERFRKPLNIGFEDEEVSVVRAPTPAGDKDGPTQAEVNELRNRFIDIEVRRLGHIANARAKDGFETFISWVDSLEAPGNIPRAAAADIRELYQETQAGLQSLVDEPGELLPMVQTYVTENLTGEVLS